MIAHELGTYILWVYMNKESQTVNINYMLYN